MLHNLESEIFSFNNKDSITLLEHVVCLKIYVHIRQKYNLQSLMLVQNYFGKVWTMTLILPYLHCQYTSLKLSFWNDIHTYSIKNFF